MPMIIHAHTSRTGHGRGRSGSTGARDLGGEEGDGDGDGDGEGEGEHGFNVAGAWQGALGNLTGGFF